jgi:hypothetical protein
LYKLKFGVTMLLPKKEVASRIDQYRLKKILMSALIFFTKVGTNRSTIIAQKVFRPTQAAFILGRNIFKGFVILHETIHELHRKKMHGVLFKIEFQKAYDEVK